MESNSTDANFEPPSQVPAADEAEGARLLLAASHPKLFKWLGLGFAILICLVSGHIYAFGSYSIDLKVSSFYWSHRLPTTRTRIFFSKTFIFSFNLATFQIALGLTQGQVELLGLSQHLGLYLLEPLSGLIYDELGALSFEKKNIACVTFKYPKRMK